MVITHQESPPRLISIIMNQCAGHHAAWGEDKPLHEVLVNYFFNHGCEVELHLAKAPHHLSHLTRTAVARHRNRDGVIVAAGGDGTLNTVAQILMHGPTPMGIIPLGTFNYVARALDIPLDPLEAAYAILNGQTRAIHIGCVNEQIYLNNASIGLYPRVIEQREADNSRFGRFRFVALLSGFAVLMREQQKLKLRMSIDGQVEPIDSPLVFFGNNPLQLQDYKLELAECAKVGRLALVAITEVSRMQIINLIMRLQRGTFEQAPEVTAYCADHVRIDTRAKKMKVAIDGEIVYLTTPLFFSVAQQALQVIAPVVDAPIVTAPVIDLSAPTAPDA